MKALKFIGILLLIVVTVFFTLPLLMSDHAEVKQSIFIEAKAQTVFRQVNNLQNWRKWSPFEMGDPEMESIYEGPKSGVGCKHIWKSKEMGDGSLTILESRPYEFIQGALTMGESGTALDEWTFVEKDGGTEATWYLKLSDLSYPFYKYFGFFAESMMQPMQEKGLAKLKEVAEAARQSIDIELVEVTSQPSITILDSVMMSEIGMVTEKNMMELGSFVEKSKVQPSGPAFAMYYNWDNDKPIKMRVGFPVYEEVKESGRVSYFLRPAGKALKGTMIGPYSAFEAAHYDMDDYITDFNYQYAPLPVWESYVSGPFNEPDSNLWITEIYYFVQ